MQHFAQGIGRALGQIEVLALFPLVALSATWFGFDDLALITAVGLSALLAISGLFRHANETAATPTTIGGRPALVAMLDRIANLTGRETACFIIQIDDWAMLQDRWGHDTSEEIASRISERLQTALRNGDLLSRLGDSRFGVVLSPLPSARLGVRDAIATRLSGAVADPILINGAGLRVTASIGHTSMIKTGIDPAGQTVKAAEAAVGEASLHGPAAIRAFAPGMGRARAWQSTLSPEVESAILGGEISAWFQPQIHAQTGTLTGMETLARWHHPKHGQLGPREFLPAVEAAGQMPLLGQTLRHQAMKALQNWDAAKAEIPLVSINLSAMELRDPSLAKTLAQEVEQYGLTAHRVVVEVQEDVAGQTDDDTIVATLQSLRDAGHRVDLDGFGLGAMSLLALQRFGVNRVKIDPSFVHDIDVLHPKRQAVAAIVAMAKALGIEILASGVETQNQQNALIDLNCESLQGFWIARPMEADNVADWARARRAAGKTIRLDDRRA